MSDIYDLMAEESRQSFFQLENITSALDSKAFGMITADTLLFSVFIFISTPAPYLIFYIPITIIIASFISLLGCVWPRHFHRQFSDDTIKNYGTLDTKTALAQIAANYADLERNQYKIYTDKFNWFLSGLLLMVIAMVSEIAVFVYFIFEP